MKYPVSKPDMLPVVAEAALHNLLREELSQIRSDLLIFPALYCGENKFHHPGYYCSQGGSPYSHLWKAQEAEDENGVEGNIQHHCNGTDGGDLFSVFAQLYLGKKAL